MLSQFRGRRGRHSRYTGGGWQFCLIGREHEFRSLNEELNEELVHLVGNFPIFQLNFPPELVLMNEILSFNLKTYSVGVA
jgi:hypothetical protein